MPIDFQHLKVYCDEVGDRDLLHILASASTHLKKIPSTNIQTYPQHRLLGAAGSHLLDLVREDRPDFIFT